MRKIKNQIRKTILNFPGWRTKRKIVVFESDDWGSIRIPDKDVVKELRAGGLQVDNCPYMLNDALENNEDMEAVFLTLEDLEKKPVLTANFLTANPNFEKIQESHFREYHNEGLLDTLKRSTNRNKVASYYRKGLEDGIFIPQLHGREHLNIRRWMNDLQRGNPETLLAFENRMFGVSTSAVKIKRNSYQAAFDNKEDSSAAEHKKIIEDAIEDFAGIFGYKPTSFIAPNYTWGPEIEATTASLGVKYLQGGNTQRLPVREGEKREIKRNILGSSNEFGQKYFIRNCSFEPFSNPEIDWVNNCMRDIKTAFRWHKPAVVSIHRVNFIGSIRKENREKNLFLFTELIHSILKEWPEVEFMSSNELGNLM